MTKWQGILTSAMLTLGCALLTTGVSAQPGASAQPPPQATSEGVGTATAVRFQGKIVNIDKANKEVTVEGSKGRKLRLRVENPYNLESAKVGDLVVGRFYEVVTIRKRKPGEVVPSASLKEGISTARPGEAPGATASQQMKLLVSVIAVDKEKQTVTVKGPDGRLETVKARNPRNLDRLNVGEELVVSVSRAVAISLEKAPVS